MLQVVCLNQHANSINTMNRKLWLQGGVIALIICGLLTLLLVLFGWNDSCDTSPLPDCEFFGTYWQEPTLIALIPILVITNFANNLLDLDIEPSLGFPEFLLAVVSWFLV